MLALALAACSLTASLHAGTDTPSEITLPPCEHFVSAAWKGERVWHVTRPMTQAEMDRPVTYVFRRAVDPDALVGSIIIREVCPEPGP